MNIDRKVKRNKVKKLIKSDGISKPNKALKHYWKDVQNKEYKI